MRLNPKRAVERFLPKNKKADKGNEHWTTIQDLYELGQQCKSAFIEKWVVNLAFLAGRQYTFYNSNANILQQVKKVKGRRRFIDNQLLKHYRRQVADLTRNDPIMSVVPNTHDDEDVKAAKLGDAVIKGFWYNDDMKGKVRLLASWIYSCGNAFLDDVWNPKAGPIKIDKSTGDPVYEGDVTTTVWSPFEISVPSYGLIGETDLHRMPWLIKSRWFTLDWIAQNFPKKGKEVDFEEMPKNFVDLNLVAGRSQNIASSKVPGALVHWFYMQPNPEYPKGLFLVGSNNIILEKSDYPFDFYALEHFKDIDIPGSFWGKATLEDAIPLQVRWNNTVNDIDEFNRTMAKGKLLEPRGSAVEILPDDSHGQRIVYKPVMGHKPEIMTLKNMPTTLREVLMITKDSFNDLFAHHEVTQGTNKSDIRSGEMVSLLREQDAFANVPSHTLFEEKLEKVLTRVLRRIQKGYANERVVKFLGDEGEWSLQAFRGAELRDNTDVRVKRQSTLPDSRVAREARILQRFQGGLYGNPVDPEVRRHVMNMLDDAVVKDIYSDVRLDENNARMENEIILNFELSVPPINSYDNHGLHLKEHNHFRKSSDYQKLKITNPQVFIVLETRFMEHTMKHQAFLQQQMQAALMRQAMVGGQTQSKGGVKQIGQGSQKSQANLE